MFRISKHLWLNPIVFAYVVRENPPEEPSVFGIRGLTSHERFFFLYGKIVAWQSGKKGMSSYECFFFNEENIWSWMWPFCSTEKNARVDRFMRQATRETDVNLAALAPYEQSHLRGEDVRKINTCFFGKKSLVYILWKFHCHPVAWICYILIYKIICNK